MEQLCEYHVSGSSRWRPEHTVDHVLKLMNKPGITAYEQFGRRFKETNETLSKRQYLVNYFISAHPGSGLKTLSSFHFTLWRDA